MKMKTLLVAGLALVAVAANAQTVWYGGDFDGVNGFISQSGPSTFAFQGIAYDDFTWNTNDPATGIRGTIFNGLASDTTLNWQIRSGMSAGNLGTLVASGTTVGAFVFAGNAFGINYYNMTAPIASTSLVNGNTYHLGVQVVTTSANSSVGAIATTAGVNGIGGPINNGNAFQWDSNAGTVVSLGADDLSLGIMSTPIPEPASIAALGLGALALIRRRRSKKA
jgi:hypothetical protein